MAARITVTAYGARDNFDFPANSGGWALYRRIGETPTEPDGPILVGVTHRALVRITINDNRLTVAHVQHLDGDPQLPLGELEDILNDPGCYQQVRATVAEIPPSVDVIRRMVTDMERGDSRTVSARRSGRGRRARRA